ncbi:hypothetical protein, partial [Pseudomonas floridensis]|uniref:hypothetical protein n=1 Tax=Pseudomonas floridensis TaxID=1958950 RepID=UPI001ABFF7D7
GEGFCLYGVVNAKADPQLKPAIFAFNLRMAIQRACPYGLPSGFIRSSQGSTHARNNLAERRFHGGSWQPPG